MCLPFSAETLKYHEFENCSTPKNRLTNHSCTSAHLKTNLDSQVYMYRVKDETQENIKKDVCVCNSSGEQVCVLCLRRKRLRNAHIYTKR